MESLLFVLNSVAVVVLMIMSLRDDRRRPGTAATSYFRYIEQDATNPDGAGTGTKRISPPPETVQGHRS